MTQLKEYQRNAVSNLNWRIEKCLRSSENKVVVFKAPTGSGKTLMVSEVLRDLVKNADEKQKLSFVWISVRMLHEQSKEKLEKYYEDDRLLKCSYFEDLEDRKIGENEILFINWHSINKRDINLYIKENEQEKDLGNIIRNTKDEGRPIIMIIDESHHTASSEKSKDLIELIGPKVTLEVSATPKNKNAASEIEEVDLNDVKAEGMIKNEIAINPEFLNIQIGDRSSDDIVIEQALKKREELAELYKKEGAGINPLVLIQLPDSRENLLNKKDEVVEKLRKRNITEENGKLAIWLSEEKTDNLENIEKFDNEIEALVFKQAIAVGWDCPRAAILVIFRESKSFIFTIQTIGRIMRMPERKHYKEDELNKGFVFTNLPHIEIAEDYVKDYLTLYEAKRDNKLYSSLSLPSVYLKRQRERTRLGGKFVDIFQRIANETNLKKKVNFTPSKSKLHVVADATVKDVDKIGMASGGEVEFYLDEAELQFAFDKFLIENCTPYAFKDSSDRMTSALASFLKLKRYDSQLQRIVLSSDNRQAFINALNLAKETYKREVIEALNEKREIILEPEWGVPLVISYNSRYKMQEQAGSVMKPFYTAKQSDPEAGFIKLLNESNKVKWWFKNGETESKYFAVLRTDGFTFYPDFIVQFKDGTVGLFDTKSGRTAETEDAGPRAEGLQKYIKEQNKKGKRLWGGIAVLINGSWRYNENEIYEFNPKDLSKWKILEI